MFQSKITLMEQSTIAEEKATLTLVKFREDPTMIILEAEGRKISMEMDDRQLLQLMHFINILLETH